MFENRLIKDRKGRNVSVWQCDETCKVKDLSILNRYESLLKTTKKLTVRNTYCCYAEPKSCLSTFLLVLLLAPHFLKVRAFKRLINKVRECYNKIKEIDEALRENNLIYLRKIRDKMIEVTKSVKANVGEI